MKLMRLFIIAVIVILVIVGLYYWANYLVESKRAQEHVAQTISEQLAATSSEDVMQSTHVVKNLPTATTTVPTSWKSHEYPDLALAVSYPNNLIVRREGDALVLAFPKDTYFHWPLLDDARITITATSTCAEGSVPQLASTTFSMNGYSFMASQGNEGAAGNRYSEVIYSTEGQSRCYSFSLLDHGANGAGLYVSGQALIDKYDAQHDVDIASIGEVFNSVAYSFRIR